MKIHISTFEYDLTIYDAAFGVSLDGTEVARLDVRSALPVTDGVKRIEDIEPDAPEYLGESETDGVRTFTWKGHSSCWEEKTYTLACGPLRFIYRVKVRGKGRVDGVEYFSGNGRGSAYEFQRGFSPCRSWYNNEDYYFNASEKCCRWSVLMVPPMFCYSFRCEGLNRQLGLGVAAQRGEHNFNSFAYSPLSEGGRVTGFCLSTDQDGHTSVDGEWEAPHILGFGADDEFEAMEKYSGYYYSSGLASRGPAETVPKFWRGPMACGWIEQFARSADYKIGASDLAREDMYEEYVKRMHKAGLYPRCLIIDDKWQSRYATDEPDPKKWPDLRAFVERRRAEGIHTLMWFKLFDPEGLPDECTVTTARGGRRYDPSNPKFLSVLDAALRRILSPEKDCCDCDGLKLDYAFQIPIGREYTTVSGKYGAELLHELMEHIYKTAKKYKPDALINASPCHPYFADVVDQGRLHDYDAANRYCSEDLGFRAKMYKIALPGLLLDTDNAGFNTRRDTMRWLLKQPRVGVPDLYCVSPLPYFSFEADDLAALSEAWKEYTERVDRSSENK